MSSPKVPRWSAARRTAARLRLRPPRRRRRAAQRQRRAGAPGTPPGGATRAAPHSTRALEFYAEAGAPEGALYLDGQLVGWLHGVKRL